VSQISPPFRIALVALLAVCAVWFTVLRPKSPAADAPLPAAPGATGLANDVAAAKGAATASDAANARVQDATGGSAAKSAPKPAATAAPKAAAKAAPKGATKSSKAASTGPHSAVAGKTAPAAAAKPAATATATATPTATAAAKPAAGATPAAKPAAGAALAAKPAADAAPAAQAANPAPAAKPAAKAVPAAKAKIAADPSGPLLRALDRNRAVVLLFWNRHGSDDRAVRQAAQGIDRHHGRVVVKVVPVASVGRYTAITKGVQVLEAPTVLVIAPGGKARAIAGLTSTPELNQAVADVLAGVTSGP